MGEHSSTEDIRYDMAQFYAMKAVLEQVLGRTAYRRLKETGSLADWKKETKRLLRGIRVAVKTTVAVADDTWFDDVYGELERGETLVAGSYTITALFSALASTLTRVVFLQLGLMPSRRHFDRVTMHSVSWDLTRVRSVQYVQTSDQKSASEKYYAKRSAAASLGDTKAVPHTPPHVVTVKVPLPSEPS